MSTSVIRAGDRCVPQTSAWATALPCALLAATSLATPASAQTAPPPRFENVDANGVDLVTGKFVYTITEGGIGSGDGAVSIQRGEANDFGRTDQWSGVLYRRTSSGTTLAYVHLGTISDTFTISGSTYTSTKANGGTLVDDGFGNLHYTAADGTKVTYQANVDDGISTYSWVGVGCSLGDSGTCALPMSIARPNGTVFTLNWDTHLKCVGGYDSELNCLQPTAYFRFDGVTSSASYSFSFGYQTNTPGNFSAPQADWYKRTAATFTNLVTTPSPLPLVSYSYPSAGVEELTDMAGRVWRFTTTSNRLIGIRRPGLSSDNVTIAYDTNGIVTSVAKDGVTTTYSRSVSGTTGTLTVTNALSQATVIVSNLTTGRPTSVTDALGRTANFTYDSNARLTRVTEPEGNYVNYTYDSRGNVTEVRRVAKSGSGLSDIVSTASFPSSCTVVLSCNQPTSTTDARGKVTDYTYDSTHGGVLTVTSPAPADGAVRPQVRYSYTLTNGEYRITGLSACQTTSSCGGTADEVKIAFAYDSNGNTTSTSRANGTGTLTSSSAATYDAVGNLVTVDGPLSGTADTVRFRYNAGRERIGVIGPDPDGTGTLKHRAVRTTLNGEGLAVKVERGTVNSQSDSDWTAFSALETAEATFDSNGRTATRKMTSGTTVHSLGQVTYDALGRAECVAQRMNPAEFGALPSSACTLDTQGSYGPDRIIKTVYDAAGQITQTKVALGASEEANESSSTYSSNGRILSLTDGEGNKTSYEYDGHDRVATIRYPDTTKGAGTSSTTDYEQLTYDAGSNVTSHRLRNGNSIGFTFDALNRVTAKNLPGSEPDVSYTYDALSRVTGASQTGNSLTASYDALGRNLTQGGPQGTVSSTWDIAGRRTRITHPDGFHVTQDYLVTGEVSAIRENGAASGPGVLATYAYDNLGRRTSLTRGNGSVLSYSFDNVSRLSQLADNLSGATYDQTLGFSYNPAGQVTQTTRSNDVYAWSGHYNANRNYTANGRNQYTASGSITPTYDSNGNLTSAGSTTYSYSSENLLTGATGGISLKYDPTQRLYETVGASTKQLAYDGINLIAEYAQISGSSVLQRRYVHGPGSDEAIVWYEGSDTNDRRYLHTDERGSVLAVTSSAGSVVATNNYDEYGIPATTNAGRFQFTGQTWVAELSMYYYKARFYSPTLGRFLQTDPRGYIDGPNFYNYVRSDPVNARDPTGTICSYTNYIIMIWDIMPNGRLVNPRKKPDSEFSVQDGDCNPSSGLKDPIEGGVSGGTGEGDGGGDGEGQTLLVTASLPDRPRSPMCRAPSRVYAGNSNFIGGRGSFGALITKGSAAVIARQFGSTQTSYDQHLQDIASAIFGMTDGGQMFVGLTDNMDDRRLPGDNARERQDYLMERDPGKLLIEIVGGTVEDSTFVSLVMPPGEPCPAFSTAVGSTPN